jgi:hypothetical protein
MTKPNVNSTLTEMKEYIRKNKLNHPDVKLGMKKSDMIAGLKKAGHWDSSVEKMKKSKPKKAPKKTPPKKTTKKEYTITTNPDTFDKFDKDFYVNGDPFITYLTENEWELQMNTKMGQGARFTKDLTKQEHDKFKKRFSKWFKSNQYKLN